MVRPQALEDVLNAYLQSAESVKRLVIPHTHLLVDCRKKPAW